MSAMSLPVSAVYTSPLSPKPRKALAGDEVVAKAVRVVSATREISRREMAGCACFWAFTMTETRLLGEEEKVLGAL